MGAVAGRGESYAAQGADAGNGQETRDARAVLALAVHRRSVGAANTKKHGGALYRMRWRELWEREIRVWLDATALRKLWLGPG
eukprot:3044704-Lingulodinium_polyedra.AAC.1